MKSLILRTMAAVAMLGACGAGQAAAATTPPPARENCFTPGQWKNWTTTASGDALYLRININDIYRVDLIPHSHAYRTADSFLVNEVQGSGWICSAIDLNLQISDYHGFRTPLFVAGLRKLSPAEVALIPRKELP
jgi:hypothetical protein